ncbi:hypothetical protein EHI8A_084850 [Entamoeba histolytica HM-1:IMSS-B]|uniref:Translocon-associated protein subunit alpha n=6 Tax=Entamoeba histolytica TaxID=5759 RepID=C4M944_ENTH1|nr:hypothetical protein EHI_083600 [Entamoeba histolytica HM-1:IMSS]EMD48426.1 Hypothetical protein EHI5A_037340 [Entamoeba histolytica KU27]EMH78024.1 hypothetical protein EHI8A_084850 [Entamoeba histolytica HM-1:IMSS-B]EMS15813.1 hypothetical protein KM1_120850 [Entamoeba histolytica HM-3:IMSS]ENY64069.1 hypothetical protein EHI7A_062170 [Entamoeba histolytica HM-1:IMSS-A]BAN38687.1 hypothetical protein [Entamoeba histolytica]|eukprot:XP_654420.1 hypothetical protein EHI_083600 [Entamoeba histolytica HM-1:IMSS]
MLFIFFILVLAFVNAQEEAVIETPDENQVSPLIIEKNIEDDLFFTETEVTIVVTVTNPGPSNVSNVVIYDEVPQCMKLVEGQSNSVTFDFIPVGSTVNLTYVAVPILTGTHYIDSAYVNFTLNRMKKQLISDPFGSIFIQPYKGFISVCIEWGVIIIIGCVLCLLWAFYKSKKEAYRQKVLRSKGFGTVSPTTTTSPKQSTSSKVAEKQKSD